jgi:hypothetical protein
MAPPQNEDSVYGSRSQRVISHLEERGVKQLVKVFRKAPVPLFTSAVVAL